MACALFFVLTGLYHIFGYSRFLFTCSAENLVKIMTVTNVRKLTLGPPYPPRHLQKSLPLLWGQVRMLVA
jgi:hypothetical protein